MRLTLYSTAKPSFHVTHMRQGTTIGEYHLAGQDELWQPPPAASRAIRGPAFIEKPSGYRTVRSAMALRRGGESKTAVLTWLIKGARFGDTLHLRKLGAGGTSGAEQTWEVTKANAKGARELKLKPGETISVQDMTLDAARVAK